MLFAVIAPGRCSLAVAAQAEAGPTAPLITTETQVEHAALVAADDRLQWTFRAADGSERTIAASQVVRFGNFVKPVGAHRVRLAKGGELLAHSIEMRDSEVSLDSDLLAISGDKNRALFRLPRDGISAVVFDMPTDRDSVRALEKRISAAPADVDTLLFSNGDQIGGHLVELAKDQVNFNSAATDVVVDRSRVAAVVLRPPQPAKPVSDVGLKFWVGLSDGSRMDARKILVKGASVELELAAGATASVPANAVVALQPIGGDVVYLSNLKDAGYRHIPFLTLAWDFHGDRNVTGGPLVAGGKRFLKGLGMHSAARITYNLDREYRAFQSELVIDDSTGGRGSVACRVFVDDGSGQWRLKYESPIIRGGQRPISVNVDLAGAKRLSLLVDFADRGDEQDHVDWLDARLIR